MTDLDLEALKVLIFAACEDDDPAEVGCWVRRGEVEHRLRAASGESFSLSYHRVEPEWSDGDVEILCELDAHADYIAAMAPSTTLALIAEIERLREVVRPRSRRAARIIIDPASYDYEVEEGATT